ncbi:hypothetical protein DBT_2007 [Dissulfuribacter thermophilus]|uniref:Uncharacterized protein n=1 Tax=Dissulfuribacter thermophilus TaxID=1156395 RepID=A0A1B9F433_9BACT|nr:hypothetical protein [Dissulfuribacter thermophilus]OCC14692.1 hypothetical protein DBT_2007 [Dissulfuribacter thermophilus]
MRKAIFILCFLAFSVSAKADIRQDFNSATLKAFGKTLQQIAEQQAGIPASSAYAVAEKFTNGDISGGLIEFANLVGSEAIGQIPVVGPSIFLLQLEAAFIDVFKQYLDWTLLQGKWNYFKTLPVEEQECWINGYCDIPSLEDDAVSAYLERNGYTLRELFSKYVEEEKRASMYMEYVKRLSEYVYYATYLFEPDLYDITEGDIKLDSEIKVWTFANYVRIFIQMPDGQTDYVIKKLSIDAVNRPLSFSISEFDDIVWPDYFTNYPNGVPVTITVQSSIWDDQGLVEKFLGSKYVSPNEKIISGLKNQEKSQATGIFRFTVKPSLEERKIKMVVDTSLSLTYRVTIYFDSLLGGPHTSTISESAAFSDIVVYAECSPDNKALVYVDNKPIEGRSECGYGENFEINFVKVKLPISSTANLIFNMDVENSHVTGSFDYKGTWRSYEPETEENWASETVLTGVSGSIIGRVTEIAGGP